MTRDNNCAHRLCGRLAIEIEMAEAECALDDCPFREVQKPASIQAKSALAEAVEKARGGPPPREKVGFA